MPHNYPLLLDVTDRTIVIVGGGEVAVRKAEGLIAAGATRLRAIAPQFNERMPAAVERMNEAYQPGHLTGASLVFAATDDPAVNDAVVRDCRGTGVLVCRADAEDETTGDFATPAMTRKGPVLVTVSTGGSPALSAKLRDAIETTIDPRIIAMASAMQMLRPKIRSASLAISQRREIFRALASDEALDVVGSGSIGAFAEWLTAKFPDLRGKL